MVQIKNRISVLLMEIGVSHNRQRLHKVGYFRELLSTNDEAHQSIRPLLRLSSQTLVGQPRGNQRYQPTQPDDEYELTQAIIALAGSTASTAMRNRRPCDVPTTGPPPNAAPALPRIGSPLAARG